jgi:hypothetical protein
MTDLATSPLFGRLPDFIKHGAELARVQGEQEVDPAVLNTVALPASPNRGYNKTQAGMTRV